MASKQGTGTARDGDMMEDRHAERPGDEVEGGDPVGPGRIAALLAGPLVAIAMLLLPAPAEMAPEAWRMAAIAVWMVIWWLGEALPIPATALLPLPLMPLLGVLDIDTTAARYADDIIFLFLAGFLLAAAMEKSGLHRRIALQIVRAVGTTPSRIILGMMLATAFLSMWISNTATTVMMYAVGISVVSFVSSRTEDEAVARNFGVALMLATAYAANIGGVGTLIGTPPNALLASFVADNYDVEISFFRWMLLGVPIVLVMLPLTWLLLTRFLFPSGSIAVDDPKGLIEREVEKLGRMDRAEKIVGAIFLATATLWITRTLLTSWTGLALNDTIIGIAAAILLFSIPVDRNAGIFALDWKSAREIPWGVLLLFGGGLALAKGFQDSGLAEWIGNTVTGIDISTWLLILVVTTVIVFLTECTSNTASTATFLPILGAAGVGMGLDPLTLTVPVALGASMAFMMPVATPPNAIVFSYEKMQLSDMVRAGIFLNILGIAAIFVAFSFLAPLIFGVEPRSGG